MIEENKFSMSEYDHQLSIMKENFSDGVGFKEGIGVVSGEARHLQNLKVVYKEDKEKMFFWNADLFPWSGSDNLLFKDEDWHDFWKITKKHFPLYSVAGTSCLTVKEIVKNEYRTFKVNMLPFSGDIGMIVRIDSNINTKPVLEIGFGYGGVGIHLLNQKKKYYGIDYAINHGPLRKMPRNFIEIKTSGIPEKLLKLKCGIVYSSNVFQHLTHKQKLDYFKQVSHILDDDGIFYFDVFDWNYELNEEITNPKFSTKFFMAETCIETKAEIEEMLKESGLNIIYDKPKKSQCEFCQHQYYCQKANSTMED